MTHYYEETAEQKDAFWAWAAAEEARVAVKAVLAARKKHRCVRCLGSGKSAQLISACIACDGSGKE
jgi:hypothetical protein